MRPTRQPTSAPPSTAAPARRAGAAVLALVLMVYAITGMQRLSWASADESPATPVPDPAVVAEIYDPATASFTSTGRLASDRLLHSAALTPDGEVLVANGLGAEPEVETYSPATGRFTAHRWDLPRSAGEPPFETAYDHAADLGLASAALLNDGRLFLIGEGYAFYDIGKRTFTDVTRREGSFRFANKGRVIARLANGQVLIIGGFTCLQSPKTPERDLLFVRWPSSNSYGVVCSTGEIYDPAAPAFIPLGDMTIPRYFPSATPLDNGDALIAGGFTGDAFTKRTELYDSRTRKFVRQADMAMPRIGHTTVRLKDGRILIAGGFSGADFATSAEIFDPKTRKFIPTGSMLTGRECATATLLKSGKVLIVGGRNADGILSEAELYDPRTRSFTRANSMTVPRYFHTATMMRDGRVLIVGGASTIRTGAAEIYDPRRGVLNASVTFAPLLIGAQLRPLYAFGRVWLMGWSYRTSLYIHSRAVGRWSCASLMKAASRVPSSAGTL
jgi:Galactose oxidase, central domain